MLLIIFGVSLLILAGLVVYFKYFSYMRSRPISAEEAVELIASGVIYSIGDSHCCGLVMAGKDRKQYDINDEEEGRFRKLLDQRCGNNCPFINWFIE